MSDGPKIIINSADVPATARLRFRFTTDNCVIPGGTVKIESHDGTSWRVVPDKTATVTTTCARCSATIDPAAVEQHHAVCFVAGDPVRWTSPIGDEWWAEGEVLHVDCIAVSLRIATVSAQWLDRRPVEGTFVTVNRDLIRHIQRPGQAIVYTQPGYNGVAQLDEKQPTLSARLGHLKHGPGGSGLSGPCDADCRKCQVEGDAELQDAMERIEPIAPTLIDGLTAEECLDLMQRRQREATNSQFLTITPGQLVAARDLWQQQLRARISACEGARAVERYVL